MADIDEIRQQMFDDLERRVKEDQRLGQIRRSIQAGDYSRAAEYGARCGEILSSVLRSNMDEEAFQEFSVEDLGRLMMPVIQREFEYVSNAVTASQRAQNEETGIGIQPLRSELNASEYYNIFGKMKSYGSFRNASYLLDEPIALNSLETVDDAIRQNAEFQSAAGLKVKMIRTAEAGCCEFCDERAGEYEFPNVPDTAWERHNNCRCEIRIETEKKEYSTHQKSKQAQIPSNADEMGKPRIEEFRGPDGKTNAIRVYENDKYPGIYNQTYSQNSQKISEQLNQIIYQEHRYSDVDEIVVARRSVLNGISAYDPTTNKLFISEELIDPVLFTSLVDADYFPAKDLSDVLEHELGGHQSHWNAIKRFYEDNNSQYRTIGEAKEALETELRRYVKTQMLSDPDYLINTVSENADRGFDRTGLNETIADVKVLEKQGVINDPDLLKLVNEVLNYDG